MKSILVIGLGRFGTYMAKKFSELGNHVLVLDTDEEKINEILPYVTSAQIGDATKPAVLDAIGIDNFDVCSVCMGENFQSSLETTSLLKELGAKMVISRAARTVHEKFLLRNGADEVVYPERQLANWTAVRYTADHILDYIQLDGSHGIFEISVPPEWVGKTIGELDIRKKYQVNVMGTKSHGEMNLTITPDTLLSADNTMLVLGSIKDVQKHFGI